MIAMSLCAASVILALAIVMSAFHLGRPGKQLALCAAIIMVVTMALAWRIARFVEDSNAVRSDARQIVAAQRRVETDLRKLSHTMGGPAHGGAEEMIRDMLARQADRQLVAAARPAPVTGSEAEAPVWARPEPLSHAQVLERLNWIYANKLAGEGASAEISGAPAQWLNEQLEAYGFAWRVKQPAMPTASAVTDADTDG